LWMLIEMLNSLYMSVMFLHKRRKVEYFVPLQVRPCGSHIDSTLSQVLISTWIVLGAEI